MGKKASCYVMYYGVLTFIYLTCLSFAWYMFAIKSRDCSYKCPLRTLDAKFSLRRLGSAIAGGADGSVQLRFDSAAIMAVAVVLQSLAALTLLLLTLSGYLTLWSTVPLIMVVAGMAALAIPNALASFLAFFERDSGAATGLNGCLQFLMAGLIGSGLGLIHNGTPLPMTALMAASAVGGMLCFFLLARERPGLRQ